MSPEPADNASIKTHNLGLVWRCVADYAPIGRVEIAERIGISKGALTSLTAELIELGLIRRVGARANGRGRPVELLAPDGTSYAVMAVQIHRDELAAAVMDLGGALRWREVLPHGRPMGDPNAIATMIARMIERAAGRLDCRLERVCIIMAAPLWGKLPIVPAAVDFGWSTVDLLALIRQAMSLDLPLNLVNDAAAAAIAEHALLGESAETFIYLKSNTGIGGAAFTHNQPLLGAHNTAFEPGHIVVDPDGQPCECGQRGCLATVASPEVVLRAAGLADLAESRGQRAALEELLARRRRGDARAIEAISTSVEWIARVLITIRVLFDPDVVVLGGYWSQLADQVEIRTRELWRSVRLPQVEDLVTGAKLGEDAALMGALRSELRVAALQRFISSP